MEAVDQEMIDAISANDAARSSCLNLIRHVGGVGGVAKIVLSCHDLARDIHAFEAELAALNAQERNLRDESVDLRGELEKAVMAMEVLVRDSDSASPPMWRRLQQQQQQQQSQSQPKPRSAASGAAGGNVPQQPVDLVNSRSSSVAAGTPPATLWSRR